MKILAKTFQYLEDILEKEIEDLGGLNITKTKRGVWFDGNKELLYKSNIALRTALRVLVPIHEFTAYDDRRLYKHIYNFDWIKYLSLDKTFAIDPVTKSARFRHSQYVGLRIKDAIVDKMRDTLGDRPNIDSKNPDILINVHLNNAKFTISLDSSGDTLNKRGYRENTHPASLNESLAAGLIMMSDWDKNSPLYDPFCGSGTIPFEAYLIASNIAPGLNRSFAFMNWSDFDNDLYLKVRKNLKSREIDKKIEINGSDISEKSVKQARDSKYKFKNSNISFKTKDFFDSEKMFESGTIVTNPPYGARLKESDIEYFYKKIGDTLKTNYTGWDAWILSGNPEALKRIGLRTDSKNNIINGDIECKFNKYSLYKGSRR